MSDNSTAQQAKKLIIARLLDQGRTKILVATRHPETDLPAYLKEHPHVPLNLSRKFPGAMDFTDVGISVELTFQHVLTRCLLPWEAISMAEGGGEGFLFADAIYAGYGPTDLVEAELPELPSDLLEVIEGGKEVTPPRRNHLRLLP